MEMAVRSGRLRRGGDGGAGVVVLVVVVVVVVVVVIRSWFFKLMKNFTPFLCKKNLFSLHTLGKPEFFMYFCEAPVAKQRCEAPVEQQ